jgi:hypothetical protein
MLHQQGGIFSEAPAAAVPVAHPDGSSMRLRFNAVRRAGAREAAP